MKKLLLLLPFGLLISACSNDFEVTAPWKEIPIVYGILSPQDSAHYIRVEKAFLDPEVSALTIAQIADSLYFPESAITVWLVRTADQVALQLQRVNGALEGYPRDSGVFAGQPNWLYKAIPTGGFSLEASKTYRLEIRRNDGRPPITSETTLPTDFTVVRPLLSDPVPKIVFAGSVATQVKWRTDVNGYYFNLTFRVRINERNLNGTLADTHEFVWEAAKNLERGETPVTPGLYDVSSFLTGNSFYHFLAKNLQRPAPNRYREFATCDIIIDGGGKEIKEYLETASANGGLTGAETFPNYTNISEGFGIFTAKNRTIAENIRIDAVTVDSMNLSSIADTLGFVK
ncbi:MAG: hypothetical protein ACKVU0_00975 [Saprospiraceae bacterium]